MSTYLMVANFYDEVDAKYRRLRTALYGQGSIIHLMKMEVLVSTINDVLIKVGSFSDIPTILQDHTSLPWRKEQFIALLFLY